MSTMEAAQILLVEDNPDDVEIAKRALARSGLRHELHVACDGAEAITLLQHPEIIDESTTVVTPDLIFLDLNLPKKNGLEVLQRIKKDERLTSIPVIMLTTSERDEDVQACYQCGANSYIPKPVEFREFLRSVQIAVEYWLSIAKLPSRGSDR